METVNDMGFEACVASTRPVGSRKLLEISLGIEYLNARLVVLLDAD